MYNSSFLEQLSNKENSEFSDEKNDKDKELDDIILALKFAIDDINKEQNKFYIIQELENIITRIKKFSLSYNNVEINLDKGKNLVETKKIFIRPPSSGLTTIDLKKNSKAKYNYSPLRPPRKSSKDYSRDTNLSNSNSSTRLSRISNKSKLKSRENYIRGLYSSSPIINMSNRNCHSPSPIRYDGNLINGKKEGKGIYYYPNGCKYEGHFKNDKKEGKGIFYYSNGDRYEGRFKEGNYEGKGIFYFTNGDRYEGNFEKNKYSGKGIYYYHNGDYFDGYWIDDKKTGEGIYYYKNGDKIIGKYYNGKPYGTHVKHCLDGKKLLINY